MRYHLPVIESINGGSISSEGLGFLTPCSFKGHWPASLLHLLSEQSRAVRLLAALEKLSFAVMEHAKIAEQIEQLVVAQEIGGISRMAEKPLVDEIGLENNIPPGL